MCVCEAAVPLWLELQLADRGVAGRCPAAAVVSLSKELYSHCSSPPSCINGDLAIAGEANAKPCMSHLMVEPSGGTLGAYTIIHEVCAAPPQGR